jgi:hypothetical protein
VTRFFGGILDTAKTLVARLRRRKPVAMIGTPPSARPAIPDDPAEHAMLKAREWADVAEAYVQRRMRELGIPERQIGVRRRELDYQRVTFLPHEGDGGGVTFDGINVDSGVLNPRLNAAEFGPEASMLWAKGCLRDRIDAVIAHEHEEAKGVTHEVAIQRAADSPLPISDHARRILRAIAENEKRGTGH